MAWVVGCHGKPASTDRMNLRRSDQLELKGILQSVKVDGNAGKLQEILKSLAEKKKVQVIFVTLELLRDKGFDFHSSNYLVGISACAKSKLWQHACLLFSSLPEAKLQPDVKSFNAAVSACEKGGQWQQALRVLDLMQLSKLVPDPISCNAGISACAACGWVSGFMFGLSCAWCFVWCSLLGTSTLRCRKLASGRQPFFFLWVVFFCCHPQKLAAV